MKNYKLPTILSKLIEDSDTAMVNKLLRSGIEIADNPRKISESSFDFSSISEAISKNRGFFDLSDDQDFAICASQTIGGKPNQEDELMLSTISIKNPQEYFREIFSVMVDRYKICCDKNSGTTAAMYYLCPKNGEITIANLGDSRVYLTIKHKERYRTILLTEDHNCNLPRIANHIIENGGFVGRKNITYRLNNKLAVGGAIGDMCYMKNFADPILRTPDIITYNIRDLLLEVGINACDISGCEFTITNACDGLTNGKRDMNYDFGVEVYPKHTLNKEPLFTIKKNAYGSGGVRESHYNLERKGVTLSKLFQRHNLDSNESIAEFLVKDANKGVKGDNISLTTCSFSGSIIGNDKDGILGALFDGHGITGGHEVSQGCLECMKIFIQTAKNSKLSKSAIKNTVTGLSSASIITKAAELRLWGYLEEEQDNVLPPSCIIT